LLCSWGLGWLSGVGSCLCVADAGVCMITVLRLGHRRGRDDRISTHVGLTARQFGADRIVFGGAYDANMMESIRDLSERWGGSFDVSYTESYRSLIEGFDGVVVQLTMYGERFEEGMAELAAVDPDDMLVVVGSQKVPHAVYDLADYNIGVGNQPHSEVAAVGVFLYEYFDNDVPSDFPDAEMSIEPSNEGKTG